jgi:AAA domain
MSTKRAERGQPDSFSDYRSSPEYAELRGVDGFAATAKAGIVAEADKRRLLFFTQAMSLREGGMGKFASNLIASFPDRLGTPTMHRLGIKPGQVYSEDDARAIRAELGFCDLDVQTFDPKPISKRDRAASELLALCKGRADAMADALVELCINPRCEIHLSSDDGAFADANRRRFSQAHPELSANELRPFSVPYFRGLADALTEYERRFTESASAGLAETEVAMKVHRALDRGLRCGKMVVLEGESGIGKTKAAQSWCEMHLGQARFVTLSGCVNKTSIFHKIGRALGLAIGYMNGVTRVQARIEDMLQRSRLMLVIDEAHFLFGQGERIYSRPEMIDWIDTALCNEGVPVALVATPQFTRRLDQVEKQTIWQSTQFRRRIKDFERLPARVCEADLESVARKLLQESDKASIKLVVGHAQLSKWPLTWIADLAEDARILAEEEGRSKVAFADIEGAIQKFRMPSDLAQATAFEEAAFTKNARRSRSAAARPLPDPIIPERGSKPVLEIDRLQHRGTVPVC